MGTRFTWESIPSMKSMTKNKALHSWAAGTPAMASETAMNASPGPVDS